MLKHPMGEPRMDGGVHTYMCMCVCLCGMGESIEMRIRRDSGGCRQKVGPSPSCHFKKSGFVQNSNI